MFAGVFTDHEDGYYSDAFEYPFNKLLVWAVLSNMHHMALFMWQRGDENLAKALVAGKLYKDMSREIAKDERKADVAEILARNSRYSWLAVLCPPPATYHTRLILNGICNLHTTSGSIIIKLKNQPNP